MRYEATATCLSWTRPPRLRESSAATPLARLGDVDEGRSSHCVLWPGAARRWILASMLLAIRAEAVGSAAAAVAGIAEQLAGHLPPDLRPA